jgi:trigger factor
VESNIINLDDVTRQISITVSTEEVLRTLDEAYNRLNKQVRVQGFRKGKAPRKMLESLYKHQVEQEVTEDIVGTTLQRAAADHGLDAVGRPKIEGADLRPGQPLVFTATVQVIPEFEIRALEGERFTKKTVRVTDEEVDEQLANLAQQFASFVASEEEPLAEGDYAVLDFFRLSDGVEAEEGKVQNHPLIIGEGSLHPVFEEQLVGVRRGEVREVSIPADETVAEVSRFRATIKEVKKRRVPPIDENLARTVGEESLDSLLATLRREMKRAEAARADERLRADLSRRLVEFHDIPVPDALIEHAMNRLMGDLQRSMAARGHQLDASQIQAEKLSERLRKPAQDLATNDMILDKIAQERKIEPTEADLQAEVVRLARQMDREPAPLLKEMESQGTLEGLRADMQRRLVLDTLLSELEVDEKIVSRKEVEEN